MHEQRVADQRLVHRATRAHRVRSPGFTLVETLLSIALIGILIGLLLPTLSGVRDRARGTVSMAQLRSHGQVMHIYAADYEGYFPIYSRPDGTGSITTGERTFPIAYFSEKVLWPWAMADEYYGGRVGHPSFRPPGYRHPGSPYIYTVSYMATPEFWNPSTRVGPEQWRGVISDRTAWPSAKGLLVNWASGINESTFVLHLKHDTPCDTVFVDGSARIVLHGDFVRPIHSGEGAWPGHTTDRTGEAVVHTFDGVLGRDVR